MDDFEVVANEIKALSQRRKQAADSLRLLSSSSLQFDFLEQGFSLPVVEKPFSGTIAAVDGGILGEELHAVDLFAWRSVAAVFNYSSGKLVSHDYFPSAIPPTSFKAEHSLQSHEFNWAKSLYRLNSEISCAVACCKKHSPQILFLDGSIVPQVADKPSSDSTAFPLYESLLDNLFELYQHCSDNNVVLAGVIKDSRGKRFIDLLLRSLPQLQAYSDALSRTSDTAFLSSFLTVGTRTPAFKYASNASETAVLRDLGEWGKRVASFYLRPVEYDRPLRIDFLSSSKSISSIAETIYSLSNQNRSYGYPAVLIEADLRAAMRPEEIDHYYARLQDRLGFDSDLFKLRRNSRPFR